MGIKENKDFIREFFDRGNAGDMEGILAALSDEVRWTNIGTTDFSGTFNGKKDLVARLFGPLFGQLDGGIRGTIRNVIAEGDHVVVQSSGQAVTRDGRPYNNTYCHVFRLENGKIQEVTEYLDTELLTATFSR